MLKDLGLDKWQYQLPLGIWLAVPVISNEVLMLSEETQLVGVFAMFCGASYVLGNQAVADMLDAKGKAIIAQHNALEDEAIASIKEVVDAHAGRVALLGELKAISGAQAEALGLLKAAKTMELQHAVRDSIVKKLDTLVAKDELVTAGIQAKLVADAAAAVTGQFASPEVKTKALTEAIDALSSPDAKPALVTDLFAAHFKAAATSAAAKQGKEVELPAAALAELNDELAALAKRDGYDGPVAKMPARSPRERCHVTAEKTTGRPKRASLELYRLLALAVRDSRPG